MIRTPEDALTSGAAKSVVVPHPWRLRWRSAPGRWGVVLATLGIISASWPNVASSDRAVVR